MLNVKPHKYIQCSGILLLTACLVSLMGMFGVGSRLYGYIISVALLVGGGTLLMLKGIYEQRKSYIAPMDRLVEELSDIVYRGNSMRRLQVKEGGQLAVLADLCNELLERLEQERDESRFLGAKSMRAMHLLLSAFEAPTVVFCINNEVFVENVAADKLFEGDGGHSLFEHFREAVAGRRGEFESHGMKFGIYYPGETGNGNMLFIAQIAPR